MSCRECGENNGYFFMCSLCNKVLCRGCLVLDMNNKCHCRSCYEGKILSHPSPKPAPSPHPAAPADNPINHPSYYNTGNIEVIDFIEDQRLNENYHLANVIKYVCRARHKGNYVQDLEKAQWYLDREIQRAKKAIAAEIKERNEMIADLARDIEAEVRGGADGDEDDGGTTTPEDE